MTPEERAEAVLQGWQFRGEAAEPGNALGLLRADIATAIREAEVEVLAQFTNLPWFAPIVAPDVHPPTIPPYGTPGNPEVRAV